MRGFRFRFWDASLLVLIFVPVFLCSVLKVLTYPQSEGIRISGAMVFFEVFMPIQNLVVTEAQINSLAVIISLFFLFLYLTHGMGEGIVLKRHIVAEFIVEKVKKMVIENMGEYFKKFAPFIMAMLSLSALSSLLSLFGLYPPTADLNVPLGWAMLVFILITFYKLKCGVRHYIKSFARPLPMAPLNIISEVATPISMAFRHYGNILSGTVISVLVAYGLRKLSSLLLGKIGTVPILQVGLPAVLSVYFDIFSGLLQAYIFAMLTMLYVAGGLPEEIYKKTKN